MQGALERQGIGRGSNVGIGLQACFFETIEPMTRNRLGLIRVLRGRIGLTLH
jgi:hypothetical protein